MLSAHQDPIAAIATAPGRGAVGVVRVSGATVAPVIAAVCGRSLKPREATLVDFRSADGSAIDRGLAIHFPAPNSYTGEDVLELQAHGGTVVLQLLLARCLQAGQEAGLTGMRVAQPGEFSQRAFLNGKMDLVQAEAVADLIDASTEAAARSASRSLGGGFSLEVHALRDMLVHLRMLVEATLDFPEEEDVDFLQQADAKGQLQKIAAQLSVLQGKARQGALLREGITVVIAGQPNAGKSSLLNALAGAELAIVTPVPGTTRDKVQQTIQIEGVPVHVVDTAGLRDSSDIVEQIGIARAWDAISGADVVLFLHDLTRADTMDYIAADADVAREMAQKLPPGVPVLHLWNKVDLAPLQGAGAEGAIKLSARTGAGLSDLRHRLLALAGWQVGAQGIYSARQRHVLALQAVQAHLMVAMAQLDQDGQTLDLLAEELRLAQNALNQITGEFTSDDLLGVIFSSFCIGK